MRLPNIPRRGRGDHKSRGQSLVEFALVLPIILMLTLIALDFGRVYLGWINLQSMARIGANLAANNPTAWSGSGDAAIKARYQAQIKNDATANNCRLPVVGGVQTAPAPTFTGEELGDEAHVALTCTFGIITPGISNILGGSVAVSSSAVFPVKTGMTVTDNTGGGSPPNAAFTGNGDVSPSSLSGPAPFNVVFRDTSGGSPTSWLWDFNDGSPNSTLQDPLDHVFAVPGTYLVTLTATNALGSSTATMGITVTAVSVVDFTTDQNSGAPPLTVNFTDASTSGGTAWDWTFGTGEGTGTGQTVSHTYNTAGTYTVSLTVTYPTGPVTLTKTNYITVASGLCTAPSLNGVKRNDAQAAWTGRGFTGTVSDGPGAPNGNYTITTQSLVGGSNYPCTSAVVVNRP
ncbi:MAG: cell surface protein [Chloroflexota bacterium]|jgi:PKD repeat protein|nr:cell surface protein [Chloroflexota bacterium]